MPIILNNRYQKYTKNKTRADRKKNIMDFTPDFRHNADREKYHGLQRHGLQIQHIADSTSDLKQIFPLQTQAFYSTRVGLGQFFLSPQAVFFLSASFFLKGWTWTPDGGIDAASFLSFSLNTGVLSLYTS
jgi:hypothetical protein